MLGVVVRELDTILGPQWFGVLENVGPPIFVVVFGLGFLGFLVWLDRGIDR
jgi:hypothetical protein